MECTVADDPDKGLEPLALAALQSQIAKLREDVDRLERLAAGEARLGTVARAIEILAAIAGELHTNQTRSDIAPLVKELKALIAPVKEEEHRAAA
jgi:hypothetical protein